GLEFHTVFVSGLEEGLFPHENSMNEFEGLEEERRLMYVAMTRAKRRLYLTLAQSRMLHGQTRYNIASRFFDEVPAELLQWFSPRRRAPYADTASWGGNAGARAVAQHRPDRIEPPSSAFRIGQTVRHAKFGVGIIIDAEGRGADQRV